MNKTSHSNKLVGSFLNTFWLIFQTFSVGLKGERVSCRGEIRVRLFEQSTEIKSYITVGA